MNAEQIAALATLVGGAPSMPASADHPAMGQFVIARCKIAGVHFGRMEAATATTITLTGSRRIWSWEGAFTLSAVATDGPTKCRLGAAITVHLERADVGEIIPISQSVRDKIVTAGAGE